MKENDDTNFLKQKNLGINCAVVAESAFALLKLQ